jgi:hypothetical protein
MKCKLCSVEIENPSRSNQEYHAVCYSAVDRLRSRYRRFADREQLEYTHLLQERLMCLCADLHWMTEQGGAEYRTAFGLDADMVQEFITECWIRNRMILNGKDNR